MGRHLLDRWGWVGRHRRRRQTRPIGLGQAIEFLNVPIQFGGTIGRLLGLPLLGDALAAGIAAGGRQGQAVRGGVALVPLGGLHLAGGHLSGIGVGRTLGLGCDFGPVLGELFDLLRQPFGGLLRVDGLDRLARGELEHGAGSQAIDVAPHEGFGVGRLQGHQALRHASRGIQVIGHHLAGGVTRLNPHLGWHTHARHPNRRRWIQKQTQFTLQTASGPLQLEQQTQEPTRCVQLDADHAGLGGWTDADDIGFDIGQTRCLPRRPGGQTDLDLVGSGSTQIAQRHFHHPLRSGVGQHARLTQGQSQGRPPQERDAQPGGPNGLSKAQRTMHDRILGPPARGPQSKMRSMRRKGSAAPQSN